MTYKFTTLLQWFNLGESYVSSTLWIEWYHYDADGVVVNGFDFKQVPLVESYLKSIPNFGGVVSYNQAYEEEIPTITPTDLVDNPDIDFPAFVLLSQKQEFEDVGIPNAMDIRLCKEDRQIRHEYPLEFAMIGKIKGQKG